MVYKHCNSSKHVGLIGNLIYNAPVYANVGGGYMSHGIQSGWNLQ